MEPLGAEVFRAFPGDVLGVLDAAVAAEGFGAEEPQAEVGGGEAFERKAVRWGGLEIGAELVVEVESISDIGTGPERGVTHLGTM